MLLRTGVAWRAGLTPNAVVTATEEALVAAQIPARNSSKYAGQYAGTASSQRMVEIFADSCRIALSSKKPDTAGDRFGLAVETYHQLMSMGPAADVRQWAQQAMENLVEAVPDTGRSE